MPASLVRRAYNSTTRLGLRRSLQTLWSMVDDQVFEWRYGTNTLTRVPQAQLAVISPERQAEAKPYVPTRARAVRHIIAQARVPRDVTFVDVGCGKGKVLLVAATEGFRRIKGIEFAPELASMARSNVQRLQHDLPQGTTIDVLCADATQVDFGPDDSVFFLFNPFGADVMAGFCRQLQQSLLRHPRPVWLLYADPQFLAAMQRHLPVQVEQRSSYGGYDFAVLVHRPLTH